MFLTKIGEVNVTDTMQQQNAVIGGEGNGGVIYPRINFARDSLVGMALVLHLLAESGKSVTRITRKCSALQRREGKDGLSFRSDRAVCSESCGRSLRNFNWTRAMV